MTTDERAETVPATAAEPRRPPRDEATRARAYLDLWERHLTQSAVDGPIHPGCRQPA
jgi:hypothetical protein